METTRGKISPDLGNEIRVAIVDWCATYKQPESNGKFTNVRVHINTQGVDPHRAIEIFCESSGGHYDRLTLQKDVLAFAAELKSRHGVTIDELSVGYNDLHMSFLAPDGERIPPVSR